jgi:hypothetical protein
MPIRGKTSLLLSHLVRLFNEEGNIDTLDIGAVDKTKG